MKTLNVGKGQGHHAGNQGRTKPRHLPGSIDPGSPHFFGNRSKDPITIYIDDKVSGAKDKRFKPNSLAEQSTQLINMGDATRSSNNSVLTTSTKNPGTTHPQQQVRMQPTQQFAVSATTNFPGTLQRK